MSFSGNTEQAQYLPTTYVIPDNLEELKIKLTQDLNDIAINVNSKDRGLYVNEEIICGQTFLPTYSATTSQNIQERTVFRKVIETGVLATGANNIAHNIAVTTDYRFTRIYGVIGNYATPVYAAIPDTGISIIVNATNVVVTIPAGYNGYSGHVVLEYVKI